MRTHTLTHTHPHIALNKYLHPSVPTPQRNRAWGGANVFFGETVVIVYGSASIWPVVNGLIMEDIYNYIAEKRFFCGVVFTFQVRQSNKKIK